MGKTDIVRPSAVGIRRGVMESLLHSRALFVGLYNEEPIKFTIAERHVSTLADEFRAAFFPSAGAHFADDFRQAIYRGEVKIGGKCLSIGVELGAQGRSRALPRRGCEYDADYSDRPPAARLL
jgi:hypothetical protein